MSTCGDAPLFILYGSATGNAEYIAKDLAASYEKLLEENKATNQQQDDLPFRSVVCYELDQFKKKCQSTWEQEPPAPLSSPSSKWKSRYCILFVASTTGNGDPPENASRFFRYVKRKTTPAAKPFQHCLYAVLGLGDTNYDKFCNVGKILDKRIEECGGERFVDLACADEATGLEDVVEPWKESIFAKMTQAMKVSSTDGDNAPPLQDEVPESGAGDKATSEPPSPSTAAADAMPSQPAARASSTPSTVITQEEEKKMDVVDEQASSAPQAVDSTRSCRGVETIRSLLKHHNPNSSIWKVDFSCLPSLPGSLSSCELIHHDTTDDLAAEEEQARQRSRGVSIGERSETLSTASSTGRIHYTAKRPFCSTVLNARYLTQTSTKAAELVAKHVLAPSSSPSVDSSETATNGGDSPDAAFTRLRGLSMQQEREADEMYNQQFPLEGESQEEVERNGKRVIEVTLALPNDYTLEYAPGDSLGLLIENAPHHVVFVLNMLHLHHGLTKSQLVSIDSNHPLTVDQILRQEVDLSSPLKKSNKRLLYSLSQFATDTTEQTALQLLASKTKQGQELFETYVEAQRLTVVDLLQDFPSTQPGVTINDLISLLPGGGVPPRYYSVSSSPLVADSMADGQLSLTVAFSVVDYLTPSLKVRSGNGGNEEEERGCRRIGGLVTRYLETLCSPFLPGSAIVSNKPSVYIFPKPTADFRMPRDLSIPLILIGPGTGVAPFIGFLQHRQALLNTVEKDSHEAAQTVVEGTWRGGFELEDHELAVSQQDERGLKLGVDYRKKQLEKQRRQAAQHSQGSTDGTIGPVELFFGCRHKDHDWLYRSEMETLASSNDAQEGQGASGEAILTHLNTAFSRDRGSTFRYVQDFVKSDPSCARRLARLIRHERAAVYICGDGNHMAKDVQQALVESVLSLGNDDSSASFSQEDAEAYLNQMKSDNRFLMDIWS